MNIPSKLHILGHDVVVELYDPIKDGSPSNMGFCKQAYCRIGISNDITQSQLEETLLHEIIEFIRTSLEIQMEHPAVCQLSTVLYQVLKDNKLNFGE